MKKLQFNDAGGELITLYQACEAANLGTATVRRLAEESKAVRRIGRSYRINRKIFFDYIENAYSE